MERPCGALQYCARSSFLFRIPLLLIDIDTRWVDAPICSGGAIRPSSSRSMIACRSGQGWTFLGRSRGIAARFVLAVLAAAPRIARRGGHYRGRRTYFACYNDRWAASDPWVLHWRFREKPCSYSFSHDVRSGSFGE